MIPLFTASASKVSRRILSSFFISALIPVLTIYLIIYNQVSDQLDTEIRDRLQLEARSLGLSLYDRLLAAELHLTIISSHIGYQPIPELPEVPDQTKDIFSGIIFSDPDGRIQLIGGLEFELPELDIASQQFMQEGNTFLIVGSVTAFSPGLFMVRSVNVSSGSRGLLYARLNDNYLWNFPVFSPEIVCIVRTDGKPLFCSEDVDPGLENTGGRILPVSMEVVIGDEPYLVHNWQIFLRARFLAEDLYMMVAAPVHSLEITMEEFRSTFPKLLLMTAFVVALLSINQIRRTLHPLQELKAGTHRIAAGVYDQPVVIESGDEFQDLAESFNEMSDHIKRQISTISLFSEIDRLILSSHDTDNIVRTLMAHLGELMSPATVTVITLDENNPVAGHLYLPPDKGELPNPSVMEIKLTEGEIAELSACGDCLSLGPGANRSYLQRHVMMQGVTTLVFPVMVKERPVALLVLAMTPAINLQADIKQHISGLVRRVAVAFSNAHSEEKLYSQAHYDQLTGLPNRFLFRDRVIQALERARRKQTTLALLFIDIDNFKVVNDSFGHNVGDELLAMVATTINGCVRRYDSVARLGGDEYLVLLSGMSDVDQAILQSGQTARRIIDTMAKPYRYDHHEISVTPCIGIAIYPRDGEIYEDLLRNADAAMYEAKNSGKNSFLYFDPEYNRRLAERLNIQNELRQALLRNEFTLYYQPRIDCNTGRVVCAETMLRWRHPEKGLLDPAQALSRAQDPGLMVATGRWILQHACAEHARVLKSSNRQISLSVAINHELLGYPDFARLVSQILEKSGLSASILELAIDSVEILAVTSETRDILLQLRNEGISITINDIGLGHSSLAALQDYPADRLSMNKSLIAGLNDKYDSRTIVSALLTLSHGLGLKTVAEGVESQIQCDILLEYGCDELQGHVITQPLSAEDLGLFLLREGQT